MENPLIKKLLIKPNFNLVFINAPADFKLDLPDGAKILESSQDADFVLLFVKNKKELSQFVQDVLKSVGEEGLLWICYPKGSSKVETDLNRDILWKEMEHYGKTGVSLISINDIWSAMRFRATDKVGK